MSAGDLKSYPLWQFISWQLDKGWSVVFLQVTKILYLRIGAALRLIVSSTAAEIQTNQENNDHIKEEVRERDNRSYPDQQ